MREPLFLLAQEKGLARRALRAGKCRSTKPACETSPDSTTEHLHTRSINVINDLLLQ